MAARIPRNVALLIAFFGLMILSAAPLPAQETEQWRLSWTDTLSNKNEQMLFESRHDAEVFKATLTGTNLTTGGPVYINIKLDQTAGKAIEAVKTVKDAKDAADKAKEILEKKGWVGHALDEYKDKLKDVYNQVKDFRISLTSQVGRVSKKSFDDVNRQIKEYNQQVDQFASKFPSEPQSFSRLAPVTQSDLKGTLEGDSTEGVGSGKYSVWVFKNDGGQWAKQPERTLNTDDAKAVTDYVAKVKAVDGWTATTNAPAPPITMPEKKQVALGAGPKLEGTSWDRMPAKDAAGGRSVLTFEANSKCREDGVTGNGREYTSTGTWKVTNNSEVLIKFDGIKDESRYKLQDDRLVDLDGEKLGLDFSSYRKR